MHSTFTRTEFVLVSISIGMLGFIAWAVLGVSRQQSLASERQDVTRPVVYVVHAASLHEWFRGQYKELLVIDLKLRAAEKTMATFEATVGPPQKRSMAEREKWRQHHELVLSLRRQRASMVGLYNSRAQIVNQDVFRDGDIPIELN